MKITFFCESQSKLKELMLQIGVREIFRVTNEKLSFPRDVIMVGNEKEKFLWT